MNYRGQIRETVVKMGEVVRFCFVFFLIAELIEYSDGLFADFKRKKELMVT